MGYTTRLLGALGLVMTTFAGCKCSCTVGGDPAVNAIEQTPECQTLRAKHEACLSSIFNAEDSCGPEEGDCVASARARLKCVLDHPGNYECREQGGGKSFNAVIPSECKEFKRLCTGANEETTVLHKKQ